MKSPSATNPSPTIPLLIWIALQLIALILGAARIKLWAKFPANGESYALDKLLIIQFLASSFLLPLLFQTRQSTLAIALSTLPMILLACFLASAPSSQCFLAITHVLLWLAAMAVWRKVANRFDLELIAVAVFSTLNLCGITLAYFAAEAGNPTILELNWIPLIGALQQFPTSTHLSLLPSLTIFAIGLLALRVTLSTPVSH